SAGAFMRFSRHFVCLLMLLSIARPQASAQTKPARGSSRDAEAVKSEHDMIGLGSSKDPAAGSHTQHPDAQWFGDAGLGLFLHWGISSVKAMNISWPMIPGRALAAKRIDDPAERERIIR